MSKLNLELKDGTVVIEMRDDLAPKHVAQITKLANEGFYDGLTFHRVMEGFMAQGGCPTGNGTGGADTLLEAEFTKEPHSRGTCSMARSQNVNSASSQFFICLGDASFLNGQYTVWGRVVEGMEFVDNIKKGDPSDSSGAVRDPDSIISMKVEE